MAANNGSPAQSSSSDAPTITGEAAQDIVLPVWGILVPPVAQDWVNAGFRVSFATNPATVKVWMVTENGLVEVLINNEDHVNLNLDPVPPANSSLRNQNISPGSEATPSIHTDNSDRNKNEKDKKNTDSGDTQESHDQTTPSTRRMRKVPAAFARYAVATKAPTPMPFTHPRSPTPQPIAQPASQQLPRPYSPFSAQLPPATPIIPGLGYRSHPVVHQPNPTVVGTPSWLLPSATPLPPRPSTSIPSFPSSAFHHQHNVNRYNPMNPPSTTNTFPQQLHRPSRGRGNTSTFGPLDGSVVRANMTLAEWNARQAALPRDRYLEHPLLRTGPPICQPWTPELARELERQMAAGMYLNSNSNNNNFRGGRGGRGGRGDRGGRGGSR
ncbi:hypothetical protein UCDDS831_g07395 [Diplodia seriata]|uniref:Uncharacterized protein n=1 Tax=Diplodia seriata TaxID=420778 RepID=A0A0G2E0V6_9PEZI|nr:hypothetical protein UCDDS831_g07395 [Diplodia seriata]